METGKADSLLPLAQHHSWTDHDVCVIEYFHWPPWTICLATLPPTSFTPTEYEELEKAFDFIAATEIISVINILLVLNQKNSSCWEEN